jgi:hypothetical protein
MCKSNLLAPFADSIVALANHSQQEGLRYIRTLKNTHRRLPPEDAPVEIFELGLQNGCFLLESYGTQAIDNVVKLTASAKRNKLMIEAEEYRHEGRSFREIAIKLDLPERTIRSWVGFIKVKPAGPAVFKGGEVVPTLSSDSLTPASTDYIGLSQPTPNIERGDTNEMSAGERE